MLKIIKHKSSLKIAFVAIFLWSTQALFMSKGTELTDFSAILFPAFFISSFFFFCFKCFYDQKNIKKDFLISLILQKRHILIGSVLIFGSHLFFYWGLQLGPKIETNLTNYLWPLIFIILSNLLFNEKYSKKRSKLIYLISNLLGDRTLKINPEKMECDWFRVLKIVLGFLGVGLLLTHGKIESFTFSKWQGPFWGFIAGLLWAIFSVYLKLLGNRSYIALFIGVSTIFSAITWIIRGLPDIWSTLHISIYLGIFPLGLAMFAWEKALKNKYTQDIGTLAFLAPFLSTLWLYLFKIDYLNRWSFIGSGLIIMANLNWRDIAEELNKYLEKNDNFKIDKNTKLKDIWVRIRDNKKLIQKNSFINQFKIIFAYLVFAFLLLFQKCHIPVLK